MKPSVLVVDFDPRSLRLTRGLLEARGIQTSSAASAAELEAVLERGAPPVVLLDPMLPGRDGFEVCHTLKDGPEDETPTVFVASRIFRGQRYRTLARNAGADAFFERPKEESFLLQEISRVWDAVVAENDALAAREAEESAPVVVLDDVEESGSHEPPLEGITDNEIDEALFRALGEDESAADSILGGLAAGAAAAEPVTPPETPVAQAAPIAADAEAEPLPLPAEESSAAVAVAVAEAHGEPREVAVPTPLEESAGISTDPVPEAVEGEGPAQMSIPDPGATAGLWASLDRLELQVAESTTSTRPNLRPIIDPVELEKTGDAGAAHRVIDSPVGFDDAEMHPQPEEVSQALSTPQPALARDAATSAEPDANPTPPATALDLDELVPDQSAPPAPAEIPSSIESAIDNVIVFAPAEGAGGSSAAVAATPEPDGPDAFLSEDGIQLAPAGNDPAGSMGGEISAPDTSPRADSTPAEGEVVPPALEGMDAGTAELLSTLEELESSLPPESLDVENTSTGEWTGGELSGELKEELDTAISLDARPSAEEESSLENLLDQISSDDSASAAVSDPVIESAPARPRGGLLVALSVAGLLVGGGGYWLLGHAERVDRPGRVARVMPPLAIAPESLADTAALAVPVQSGSMAEVAGQTLRRVPSAEPPPTAAEAIPQTHRPTPRTAGAGVDRGEPAAVAGDLRRPAPATSAAREQAPPTAERARPVEAAATGSDSRNKPAPKTATSRLSADSEPRPDGAALLDKPPEPPAAPNPLEPTAPLVRLADLDYPLRLLEASQPRLTPEAREAGRGGRVFLNLLVGPDGRVKDARVMMEPGLGLGRAALRAVRRWRYSPPRHNGQKARVWKTEVISFNTTNGAG